MNECDNIEIRRNRFRPTISIAGSRLRRARLCLEVVEEITDARSMYMRWAVQHASNSMNSKESMEFLQSQMRGTKTNEEFLISMNS